MAEEIKEEAEVLLEGSGTAGAEDKGKGKGESPDKNPPGEGMEKANGKGGGEEKAPPSPELKQILRLVDRLIANEEDEGRKKVLAQIREIAAGTASKGAEGGAAGEPEIEKTGRKIASARLSRLKKLLEELQAFVREVEPGEENAATAPPTSGELGKRLDDLQGSVKSITDALGIGEGKPPEPLAKAVSGLSKRLETLEGKAGARASLDGQEALAGAGKGGKSVWKGLL